MEQEQSSLFSNLSFDGQAKQSLKSAANAGYIWTLVSLIGSVLAVIGHFVKKDEYEELRRYGSAQTSSGSSLASVIIGLGIAILLFSIMSKFNSFTKSAIETNSQDHLNSALEKLKNYFNTVAIILIIALILIVLGLMIVILASGSR